MASKELSLLLARQGLPAYKGSASRRGLGKELVGTGALPTRPNCTVRLSARLYLRVERNKGHSAKIYCPALQAS